MPGDAFTAVSARFDGEAIVQVRGVRCAYGPVTILRDLDFDIGRGEIFVILGGSGSGKSTLLRNLIGIEEAAEGTIHIDGEDLVGSEGEERLRLLRRFGVMFQSGALFSSMTLAQNVTPKRRRSSRICRPTRSAGWPSRSSHSSR